MFYVVKAMLLRCKSIAFVIVKTFSMVETVFYFTKSLYYLYELHIDIPDVEVWCVCLKMTKCHE